MNDKWFKDILAQNYPSNNYCDPTKIFLTLALTECGSLRDCYSIEELSTYVYRYYMSNKEVASRNFSPTIRNLEKYGTKDIIPIIFDAIKQWLKEQINGSIELYDSMLMLNLDDYSDETLNLTRMMMSTLYQKYYGLKLEPIYDYSVLQDIDDLDLEAFNKTKMKELIFEDLQFCPLTEETNRDALWVFHLYLSNEGANAEDRISKDNLLLLSRDLAQDYIDKKFYFNDLGKVINISSSNIIDGMRLGVNLLTEKRKKYIALHNKSLGVINEQEQYERR